MFTLRRSFSLFSKNYPARALVSSPHPISHIRQIALPKCDSENPQEKELRDYTDQIYHFVNEFWISNNKQYQNKKAEFEEKLLQAHGKITPEDMTPFYIDFLEHSKSRHAEFHKNYVKMSFKLALLSLNANFVRAYNTMARFKSHFFLPSKTPSRQT